MRQAFRPGSNTTDLSQLRVDPNNPGKAASNSSAFKPQAQKSDLPGPRATKASRDTPDLMSNTFGRRHSTPLAPSLPPPHPRRHSLDKAPHSNGASKKKVKLSTERPGSKLNETYVNQDEKSYPSDMEIIDISRDPVNENQEMLSALNALNKTVELNRKRSHQSLEEFTPADIKGSKAHGKRNPERSNDSVKRHQKGSVTFTDPVVHKHGNKVSKTVESDDHSSSEESDDLNKLNRSIDEDDSIDSFQLSKHTAEVIAMCVRVNFRLTRLVMLR